MAFMRNFCATLAVVVILSVYASAARALPVIAYDNPVSAGNQNYGGSLGMDFDANLPIVVTRLGVYDDGANGIAAGTTLNATIFRRTGVAVGPVATFTNVSPGTLVGGQRFIDVVDYLLEPGQYSIVAWGYNNNDLNGNGAPFSILNSNNGAISFVGTSRFGAAGLFPATPDGGPANRYRAGTFEFFEVPEPSTFALWGCLGLGLAIGSGAWYRRRR